MGLRVQSIIGCFSEFVFQFSVTLALVGLRKQFINDFVFPTWACAAGFNNNNNNDNNILCNSIEMITILKKQFRRQN